MTWGAPVLDHHRRITRKGDFKVVSILNCRIVFNVVLPDWLEFCPLAFFSSNLLTVRCVIHSEIDFRVRLISSESQTYINLGNWS